MRWTFVIVALLLCGCSAEANRPAPPPTTTTTTLRGDTPHVECADATGPPKFDCREW